MASLRMARRVRWAGRRLLYLMVLGVVALLVASIPAGPWLVVDRAIGEPEALLVLGSHEHERLPHAVEVARRWPAAAVLLTEPVVATPYNCQDCANRRETLESAGVAAARIRILPRRVRNTFDELQALAAWAEGSGVRRVLVITSPYHTRRVLMLAGTAAPALEVGVSPAPVVGGLAWPWWSRRYDRRYVVYEWAALVDNGWRHGIHPWRRETSPSGRHAIVDVPSP